MNQDVSDLIIALDKQQTGADAVFCPLDAAHGRMTAMPTGSQLGCPLCGTVVRANLADKKPSRKARAVGRK